VSTSQEMPILDLAQPKRTDAGTVISPRVAYIWIALGLAVMAQTAGSVVSQGIYVLVPFWKAEFNLSQAVAALAVTFVNGGQILSMFALGRAIDRYGERAIVGLTMMGMGATALAAAAFANSYAVLLLMILLLGAFYASVQPGGMRAILRWVPPEHRGVATGFRQASAPLGTAVAAFMLPALAAAFGWRAAMYAQGLVGIAGGIVFWWFYREDLGHAATINPAAAKLPFRELVKTLWRDGAFLLLLQAGVVMSAFQFTFTAHAILFTADHFRLQLVPAAALFAVTQVVGIPSRIIVPYVSDRMLPGRRAQGLGYTMLACAAATIAFVFLPSSTPQWVLLLTLTILGIALSWFPLYVLQIAEMAPKSAIAATVGFSTTLAMIAMSIAPPIFGFFVDYLGYGTAWILLTLPVLVTAIRLCRAAEQRPS
jgi:sugar phosphate permease